MLLRSLTNIIVGHSIIILTLITILSTLCVIVPLLLNTRNYFPNFSDPQMGFSTRGTKISNRLTAWNNLKKSTSPSGPFAINPNDVLMMKNPSLVKLNNRKNYKKKNREKIYSTKILRNDDGNNSYTNNQWKALKQLLFENNKKNIKKSSNFVNDDLFCGDPDEKYTHVVFKSENNINLFTLNSLLALCRIEELFIEAHYYKDLCIENPNAHSKCCKPWSLPNYIAVLHNKTSCLAITEEDINLTKLLLMKCLVYFYNLQLIPNCVNKGYCDAPLDCIKHNAIFNIFNFLLSSDFLPQNANTNYDINNEILKETIFFFPIAASTATIPYYHEIEKLDFNNGNISMVAMNFGIKNEIFDEYLISDMWLIVAGALFVFFSIWLYIKSLFLTIMSIIEIFFSLILSYFFYMFVLNLNFFPFMNLLAIIVTIGIGADDVFIFCKIWHNYKIDNIPMEQLMEKTIYHAFMSMFVTSLTTSVAFFASYNSSVIAVKCFGIFAGISVVFNFLLMITWFPASIVVWNKYLFNSKIINIKINLPWYLLCNYGKIWWNFKEKLLINYVINFRYFWMILLSLLGIICGIIVLYYPKIQLPSSPEFQLLKSSHPFEQYDFKYKYHFLFNKNEKMIDFDDDSNFKLPLRFVWGVLPIDNGNYLDPTNLGELVLDPNFNITELESQKWLLKFCKNLRQQSFYGSNIGPLLPNCFIETFMKSMQRRCLDPFLYIDRRPCCEISEFPFNKSVFDKCIVEEMRDIYETPSQYLIPGMAGPKFSKNEFPQIKAIIIEYDSNYSFTVSFDEMHKFFQQVENWMIKQLKTAPNSMKNGWFISDLEFYDLQKELSESTIIAITLSMCLALIVLLLSTLNILTSIYAIVTITFSIFVTVSILILIGWKLNILESITISTAIGLTVDFSLHYTINYRLCPIQCINNRIAATKYAISHIAGPSIMAAITTSFVGAFMLPSNILPYIQIGIFLVIVMIISWFYATFYLGTILSIIGPENDYGQFYYIKFFNYFKQNKFIKNINNIQEQEQEQQQQQQELNILNPSLNDNTNKNLFKKHLSIESPSSTSAVTIITNDEQPP